MNTHAEFPHTDDSASPASAVADERRHMSQLALATEAGISTASSELLQNGRAQPSREMVQLLTGMLDACRSASATRCSSVPATPPIYGERPLAAPELDAGARALQFILRQQEPFPPFVLDGQWNIVMRNDASRRIFEPFKGPGHDEQSVNVMRTVFDPEPAARLHHRTGKRLRQCLIHSLHREVATTGTTAVFACATSCSPILASRRDGPPQTACPMPPLVSMRMKNGDLDLAFFHGDDVRDAARRDAAAAEDRMLLSGGRVTEQLSRDVSPTLNLLPCSH